MKCTKILALLLAICMMSCVLIACDGTTGDTDTSVETGVGDTSDETAGSNNDETAGSSVSGSSNKVFMTVTLIIKGGKKTIEEQFPYGGEDAYLSSVIDFYNEIFNESTESCFDDTGLLNKIGDLEGDWTAYDKAKGSSAGVIESIKDFVVEDGMTIVLTCKQS